MPRRLGLLVCAGGVVLATACAVAPTAPERDNRFLTNHTLVVVAPDELQRIRSAWTAGTAAAAAPSTVPERHLQWVLDFIALSHAQGTAPCRQLDLVSVLALPRRDFTYQGLGSPEVRLAKPTDYYESWLVQACGGRAFWRVFRDAADQRDTPTVMLWRQS